MSRESAVYLLLTFTAFAFMGLGYYLMDIGSVINTIAGVLMLLIGFIIGLILYGDKWDWWQ